ncbi:hypothetical protein ACIBTP_40480 [Streptomyces avidinii]|uniref:hypothetical protein n=1 Tax=Streptomyces avidinii TaxID=1895 RepID=UPI0037AC2846
MKQQTAEKASLIADQFREKAGRAARLVRDRTPDPVLGKSAQAAAQVRDGATRAGQYAADKPPTRCWRRPVGPPRSYAATALRSWSPAL